MLLFVHGNEIGMVQMDS